MELLSTNVNKNLITQRNELESSGVHTVGCSCTLKNAKIYGEKRECLYWEQDEQMCTSGNRDYLGNGREISLVWLRVHVKLRT